MKKLLLFTILITLLGCSKEVVKLPTTYTVTNNSTVKLYDVVVFHFNGLEVTGQSNVQNLDAGESSTIKEVSNVEKVVVSFKIAPNESRLFTVTRFLLTVEQNTNIVIDNEIMLSRDLNPLKTQLNLYDYLK